MNQQEALESVLSGRVGVHQAVANLAGAVRLNYSGEQRATHVASLSARVPVSPLALIPMLELYLAGARSAHDISEWASFLLAVPAYEFGVEGDERVQAVLWSLSAPPVGRSVTPDAVAQSIERLRRP